MAKMYEVELEATNVTPKVFFNRCIKAAAKHGANIEDWMTFEDWINEKKNTPYHVDHHLDWNEPQREANKDMPYDYQTYLQNAYNFILEFDFYDDKKGFGYLYMVEFER